MQEGATLHAKPPGVKTEFPEQDGWKDSAPKSCEIKALVREEVASIFQFLEDDSKKFFDEVEKRVVAHVFTLGRLLLAYFLALRQEKSGALIRTFQARGYWQGEEQSREFGTYFGKVRYWRTYMRSRNGGGCYPLDLVLGLTRDRFSVSVMSLAARVATYLTFDQVTGFLFTFLSWSPSKTTVENTVLGFGHYTEAYFEQAPPPEEDGQVLVIQIDCKAAPTAREEELKKRRGKRKKCRNKKSARHRGRERRQRGAPRTRRKKGDKSKNGKNAAVVVMYTLKRGRNSDGSPRLEGPINRRVYASFRSKRHAFEYARREADKRGFAADSGKVIQIVTDGDRNFQTYVEELFPEATHTLDLYHALEYVWAAGTCFFEEGSKELEEWFHKMKVLLYEGKAEKVIAELKKQLDGFPKTGPGNKGRRKRLSEAVSYLGKRVAMMEYDYLTEEDLEVASGAVEGAVKHLITKRFDCGSMRWIPERAEALLALRCIEFNGDWDDFVTFVRTKIHVKTLIEPTDAEAARLITKTAAKLSVETAA